ncbi:hypothetical protein ACT3TZ_01000 [Brachybacterium sp. AOP25-B2-12]|uniref:hypothetical protein n=1 Tax=Brachybacterium sp. AOP25-B2-12 TaxID=3457710 RepID=UPI0040343AE7
MWLALLGYTTALLLCAAGAVAFGGLTGPALWAVLGLVLGAVAAARATFAPKREG